MLKQAALDEFLEIQLLVLRWPVLMDTSSELLHILAYGLARGVAKGRNTGVVGSSSFVLTRVLKVDLKVVVVKSLKRAGYTVWLKGTSITVTGLPLLKMDYAGLINPPHLVVVFT